MRPLTPLPANVDGWIVLPRSIGGVEIAAGGVQTPVEAICRMRFDVTGAGAVVADSIVADCTDAAYVGSATRLVRQGVFTPSALDGEPQTGVAAEVRFRLPG